MARKINLAQKFSLFDEHWRPKVVARVVVPRGVEHRTCADDEAQILCFEPAGVANTGTVADAIFTAPSGVAI